MQLKKIIREANKSIDNRIESFSIANMFGDAEKINFLICHFSNYLFDIAKASVEEFEKRQTGWYSDCENQEFIGYVRDIVLNISCKKTAIANVLDYTNALLNLESLKIISQPRSGLISINNSGKITFTLEDYLEGEFTGTLSVSDENGNTYSFNTTINTSDCEHCNEFEVQISEIDCLLSVEITEIE